MNSSEVLNIDVRFSRSEFKLNIQTSISKGITGLFGPSGSGKSTFLKLICGIETPDSGTIELNDKLLFSKEKRKNISIQKRKIGLVFQEGRLFPHLSVKKNLLYGYKPDSKFDFDEVVSLLEIAHLLDKNPEDCSGGEKQRIAIGRMLLNSPELLLLDEPFSALDHRLRKNIIPFLIRINEKFGLPILVVSHDLSDLLMLADKLILLENGTLAGNGAYFDLVLNPMVDCCLKTTPIINSVKIKVEDVHKEDGVNSLKYSSNFSENRLIVDSRSPISTGDRLFFELYPEDISLSLAYIDGISTQNKIEGLIQMVNKVNGQYLCLIDIGFPLLVRISSRAAAELNVMVGMDIYCLFKVSAVKNLFIVKS